MTVRFAESGQASEVRIERHAATDSKVYLDTAIPEYLAKEIVDELVPVAERGAKGEFSGLMLIVGGAGTSSDDYENVSITYYSSQSQECQWLGSYCHQMEKPSATLMAGYTTSGNLT